MSIPSSSPVIAEGLPITFRDQTVWRDPGDFEASTLLSLDFDETCFTTFISRGNGVEVKRAYEISILQVLGHAAHQGYQTAGGLSNRAPLDVIKGLITEDPKAVKHALDHAKENFAHPADITDIGTGLIARFANRSLIIADELTERAITEMLVVRKKEQLMPQISAEWPMPEKSFDEFWEGLNAKKASGEWQHLQTAIVSSGHTDFIQRVMEQAGYPHPDVYMTDDEMRRQVRPRTKPDPYALELVESAWMNAYLVPHEDRADPMFMHAVKAREIYVGDDQEKDGAMAENHGIRFIHYENDPHRWQQIGQMVTDIVDRAA